MYGVKVRHEQHRNLTGRIEIPLGICDGITVFTKRFAQRMLQFLLPHSQYAFKGNRHIFNMWAIIKAIQIYTSFLFLCGLQRCPGAEHAAYYLTGGVRAARRAGSDHILITLEADFNHAAASIKGGVHGFVR